MKIIVPSKKIEYIDLFIENGADEFYGGVIDPEWEACYGQMMEYNRRGNYGKRANVESAREFYQMVELCAKRKKPFYLTLNALKITEEQKKILGKLMDRFQNAGGTGIIFSDLSLLEEIKSRKLKPVVSSCVSVTNHYYAQFLKEAGCEKIIFPRDLTLEEMKEIIRNAPGLEYEMFFMNSGCRFTDGNCLGLHGTEKRALCEYCDRQPSTFVTKDGAKPSEQMLDALEHNSEDFRTLWKQTCAICNLYDVKDWIHSLKIVERVASEEKILRQIKLAKQNVEAARKAKSRREYWELMERSENAENFCKDYMNCYYRTDLLAYERRTKQLEEKYQKFLEQFDRETLKDKTEYVGINVSLKEGGPKVDYKIYYNTKASLDEHHPVVDHLKDRQMLRAVTRIHDTVFGPCERFDLGLAKRTPENMSYFLNYMAEKSSVMRENLEEIKKLNQMKISNRPEDAQAALYFFGFLEEQGKIEAVKTHFLTRFCADVDRIDTEDRYEDEYYLEFLESTELPAFQELVPLIRGIRRKCQAHLWMVGVDYFEALPTKYKIYIKLKGLDGYMALREAIKEAGIEQSDKWTELLEELECWQGGHEELLMDGVAICVDTKGHRSLNFYNFWR